MFWTRFCITRQQQHSGSIPDTLLPVSNMQHHPAATSTPLTPTVEPTRHAVDSTPRSPDNTNTSFNMDPSSATNGPLPLPLAHVFMTIPLPSTDIPKDRLMSVAVGLNTYNDLKNEKKIGTLCVKLAREAIFGEVMSRCTPAGTQDYPGLPREELYQLKKVTFQQLPQYWSNKEGFEKVWKTKCWVAIEQA